MPDEELIQWTEKKLRPCPIFNPPRAGMKTFGGVWNKSL